MFCKFCGSELSAGDVFCRKCGKPVSDMFKEEAMVNANSQVNKEKIANTNGPKLITCEVCNHQISSQAEICPYCGNKTKYGESILQRKEITHSENGMRWVLVISTIVFMVGLVMFYVSLSGIAGDLRVHRYTYTAPFTDHELHNLYMALISAVMIGSSIGADIGVAIRKKKQMK